VKIPYGKTEERVGHQTILMKMVLGFSDLQRETRSEGMKISLILTTHNRTPAVSKKDTQFEVIIRCKKCGWVVKEKELSNHTLEKCARNTEIDYQLAANVGNC
jgi:hypothetical protein